MTLDEKIQEHRDQAFQNGRDDALFDAHHALAERAKTCADAERAGLLIAVSVLDAMANDG